MRLHCLDITAFGPFADTATIDFDTLSESGLFLLSGATGSGKSSVLDAVCFALYGAVPGDRQQAGRLRSDQAPAGLPPSVGLEATLSGRRFRIVRSPAWDRPKKRGVGTVREPARVSISEQVAGAWLPLTSRLDEAGDLVSGLLGMTLDQFCQVALLPQGHFQAFLRADSAGRHRLLARLFRTGRFERVEAWLRDHRLALRRESEAHAQRVADLVSRLSEAADAPVPDDDSCLTWATDLVATAEQGQAAACAAADDAARVATERAAAAASAAELGRARARVVEAADTVDGLTAVAQERADDRDRLERARRAAGLRPLAGLVDERFAHLARAESAAAAALASLGEPQPSEKGLPGEVERAVRELASLRSLLPAEQRLIALQADHQAAGVALQEVEEEGRLATAERVAVLARLTEIRGALVEADEAVASLPRVEAEVDSVRTVLVAHEDVARLSAQLATVGADHDTAVRRLLDLREELLDVRERRIAGMAAELAGGLVVGDDCPVCGSVDHPRPAVPASRHPDAAAERRAQRAVDDAQAVEHALDLRVRELRRELAAALDLAGDDDAERWRGRLDDAERALLRVRTLADGRGDLRASEDQAQQQVDGFDDADAVRKVRTAELATGHELLGRRVAELETEVAAARGLHPALAPAVEQLEYRVGLLRDAQDRLRERAGARTTYAEASSALGRAALEAGFDHADQARDAELPADVRTVMEERLRRHDLALGAARQILDEPDAFDLLTTPAPDVVGLERARAEAAEAAEQARAVAEATAATHARTARLTEDLRTAWEAWSPVRERLALVTAVASFAEGKAPDNRWQMRLSAYVLTYRLAQVVAAANARLAGMSDQRYTLEHVGRRGAGETRGGLSLVVRDDWSGESRVPATLSGGETFVVSLALALGLADVVAHEAGGADLQTLFVDEGFGSLDAETLDDVLDILDTLRENGRAVGVVSHVAEMRHRIPTQVVVTKARTGSTVRIVG